MKSGDKLEYQARTWAISHVSELRETTAIDPAINLQLLIKNKHQNTVLWKINLKT